MTPDPDYMGGFSTPDLRPFFRHVEWRVMGHSFGRAVGSDWDDKPDNEDWHIWKQCGIWCREEAAILQACAATIRGRWVDIGANVGWTTAHIAMGAAAQSVVGVEPMFFNDEWLKRFHLNIQNSGMAHITEDRGKVYGCAVDAFAGASEDFWRGYRGPKVDGVCIDGDHMQPHPFQDSIYAATHLNDTGVILFHDGFGEPVQAAVRNLQDHGFRTRIYLTPHIVACCWRGDFVPPTHIPEPAILEHNLPARMPLIDWSRCE